MNRAILLAALSFAVLAAACESKLIGAADSDHGRPYTTSQSTFRLDASVDTRGHCLPLTLTPTMPGHVPCFILEARNVASPAECSTVCGTAPRYLLSPTDPAAKAAQSDPLYAALKWNCFCKIAQALGGPPGKSGKPLDLEACQQQNEEPIVNETSKPVDGWCYIDATTAPPIGNPDLVAHCPASEKRAIRFVGGGHAAPGATLFVTCVAIGTP